MKIRLAAYLQSDSIVDGEGIRTVIWTQGCPHNCFGCHNTCTHDFKAGFTEDIETICKDLSSLEGQDGITFSGGDPLCQPEACLAIAKFAKTINLNIWCYTGYTFEELIKMSQTKPVILEFLNYVDVLIDGKFVMAEKSLDLMFRGSKNQRVIDVKKSLKNNKPCVIKKYDYKENKNDYNFAHDKYLFV
ncbi:MAG: anaerobic ribonucleoside-triphosphate reductase activating protein [Bacilli bacterium]|nr:anaerobic ribonucleoside-triphosphate reductase activating protein [Bacilli bacterium]